MVVVLSKLGRVPGALRCIRCNNGSEFVSWVQDQWGYLNKMESEFSRPGKSTGNAVIEALNDKHWEECLDTTLFLFPPDALNKSEESSGKSRLNFSAKLSKQMGPLQLFLYS